VFRESIISQLKQPGTPTKLNEVDGNTEMPERNGKEQFEETNSFTSSRIQN
jgi:hypothetical protein